MGRGPHDIFKAFHKAFKQEKHEPREGLCEGLTDMTYWQVEKQFCTSAARRAGPLASEPAGAQMCGDVWRQIRDAWRCAETPPSEGPNPLTPRPTPHALHTPRTPRTPRAPHTPRAPRAPHTPRIPCTPRTACCTARVRREEELTAIEADIARLQTMRAWRHGGQ